MLSISEELKWISTLGGPLILMEKAALPDWHGSDEDSISAVSSQLTDYDRAGEISDYVGAISVGNRDALVLPMPNDTTSVLINREDVLIVRWIWAESETRVQEVLRKLELKQSWIDTGISLNFDLGDLILFDSVYSKQEIADSVSISVAPGIYSVSTLSYQPNDLVNLLLIELQRVG